VPLKNSDVASLSCQRKISRTTFVQSGGSNGPVDICHGNGFGRKQPVLSSRVSRGINAERFAWAVGHADKETRPVARSHFAMDLPSTFVQRGGSNGPVDI